jgi:TolB-like protein/Flp pilus assembly protein TadD
MVRTDGLVKVLDFGIAKYEQQSEVSSKRALVETIPGSVIGTAAYMSPEQARGIPVDLRSDIWSLSVVVYEMLTGCRPFQGDTPMDVMSAVIERNPATFSSHNLDVPNSLEAIVFKGLQKDRNLRYQSSTEVLADLKELKRKLDSGEQQAFESSHSRPDANKSIADSAAQISSPADALTEIVAPSATTPKEIVANGSRSETSGAFATKARRNSKLTAVAVAALLLVGAIALFYWYYGRGRAQFASIAVLPFKNESGDNEMEYLSDGMTDSLISRLSQLPNLSVKARSSVFRYKGRDIDIKRIASELSVQAILTGRVVQRGDNITLGLELVDPRTENVLWSEQYDRKRSDLISLQKEIARDVAQKLRVRLSGSDEQKITKDYTLNAEAYQLYARGRFYTFKLTSADIQEGIRYFQQAIQLDPNYALAYVGLSDANRSLVLSTELPPTEYLIRSKEAAEKALAIDEGLAEAHTAVGATIFWYERNWSEAENQYRRALEINPKSADAHGLLAHLLSNTGRHPEALAEIKRAREIEPLNPFLSTLEGQFLINAGKLDEALTSLQQTIELAPNFWFPHLFASAAYLQKGMYEESIKEARRASELSRTQTISLTFEAFALEKSGRHAEARAILDSRLKLSTEGQFVPPYHIAMLYAAFGEREQTYEWLERALKERDPKIAFLKVAPQFDSFRSDPKFQDIMHRVGF